ncbi:MAG: ribosome biogenesis GTPase Der, partial [Candidatus Binatia bacterium]
YYYAASIGASPPAIALFVNDPEHVTTSYLRYLENRIRARFPLAGTPLRIGVRARPRRQRAMRSASA